MSPRASSDNNPKNLLIDVEAQLTAPTQRHEKLDTPLPFQAPPTKPKSPGLEFIAWTAVNMAATIGIVFTNKAIFDDPSFKMMQTSFAAFHFVCTGLTLYVVSRKCIGAFVPKRAATADMLPVRSLFSCRPRISQLTQVKLALAMCLNVVLPNLSLAFSTVTVYQLCRVLLTPTTALINFLFFNSSIPRTAAIALIPVCLGVGVTSFYDTKPAAPASPDMVVKTTSSIGVAFALVGVLASSAYTVLIGASHKKLQMSSAQLLLNQAPISSLILMASIPWVDNVPVLSTVATHRWLMIAMSGAFASLINISQFFIIASSSPVSSTVVGHLKTVSIVSIGWVVSGRTVTDKSLYGILLTIGGIVIYSYVMLHQSR